MGPRSKTAILCLLAVLVVSAAASASAHAAPAWRVNGKRLGAGETAIAKFVTPYIATWKGGGRDVTILCRKTTITEELKGSAPGVPGTDAITAIKLEECGAGLEPPGCVLSGTMEEGLPWATKLEIRSGVKLDVVEGQILKFTLANCNLNANNGTYTIRGLRSAGVLVARGGRIEITFPNGIVETEELGDKLEVEGGEEFMTSKEVIISSEEAELALEGSEKKLEVWEEPQQPQWRVNGKDLQEGSVELTSSGGSFEIKSELVKKATTIECLKTNGVDKIEGNGKSHGLDTDIIESKECKVVGAESCKVSEPVTAKLRSSLWQHGTIKEVEEKAKGAEKLEDVLQPESGEILTTVTLEGSSCALKGKYEVKGSTAAAFEPGEKEGTEGKLAWTTANPKAVHQKKTEGEGEEEKTLGLKLGPAPAELEGTSTLTLVKAQKPKMKLQTIGEEAFEEGTIEVKEFGAWPSG
jgi:hypothetical protein